MPYKLSKSICQIVRQHAEVALALSYTDVELAMVEAVWGHFEGAIDPDAIDYMLRCMACIYHHGKFDLPLFWWVSHRKDGGSGGGKTWLQNKCLGIAITGKPVASSSKNKIVEKFNQEMMSGFVAMSDKHRKEAMNGQSLGRALLQCVSNMRDILGTGTIKADVKYADAVENPNGVWVVGSDNYLDHETEFAIPRSDDKSILRYLYPVVFEAEKNISEVLGIFENPATATARLGREVDEGECVKYGKSEEIFATYLWKQALKRYPDPCDAIKVDTLQNLAYEKCKQLMGLPDTKGASLAKLIIDGTIAPERGNNDITPGVKAELKGRWYDPSKVKDEANEYFEAVNDTRRINRLNDRYSLENVE